MRARELAELRGSEKDLRPGTSRRRSSSAPPTTTVASKFQKALKMAFGTADIRASALSAIKIAAGSLEGLGMPQGSKLSSVLSLLKASKRLGLHLDAADVKKRRSEIGKQAMYRRRSSAMIKVKFMTDRRSGAAGRASMLNSLLPSASGSMQPSRTTSQNVSRAGSFSQETPCA
ncbi:unnamed protein product [Symbiodinium pilosum]|uniref:Uncharacterized protein n=1 Tax=Symbiodinium pilosum TaxID=2952 RepID=A0A812WQY6_SYMPI|nr:unnamed protein product [Symbiodinium pilosum]